MVYDPRFVGAGDGAAVSGQCSVCGCELTDETGWGFTTTLAENAPYTLFCGEHAHNQGKGYTLADFEQMREESRIQRDLREVDLMNMVGPDVYFHVKDRQKRQKYREHVRRQHRVMSDIVDTLKRIGVIDEEQQ